MKMPVARQFFSLATALLMIFGVAGCTDPTSSDSAQAASSTAAAKASLESQDTTFVVSSETADAPADTTGAGTGRGGGFIGSGH
jgi:hypothetical protein